MNDEDSARGKWKGARGRARQRRGNMGENEIEPFDNDDERPGLLQERYGLSRDDAGADVSQLFNEL